MKLLGSYLKKRREAKGLSQKVMAENLGWKSGNSRISQYEAGKREPTLCDLEAMAGLLDTTLISMLIDPDILPNGVSAEQLGLIISAILIESNVNRDAIYKALEIQPINTFLAKSQ